MKKIIFLFFAIGAITPISSQTNNTLSIHEQLVSLNSNWNKTEIIMDKNLAQLDERSLIQLHLSLVEKKLREKVNLELTSKQKINREKCLNILNEYWRQGVFPKNSYHKERTPYFIDDFNVACAVGQLLISTGNSEIAHNIKEQNNYNYIDELDKKYPEIKIWAEGNGLLLDELAWIQPCYCSAPSPGTIKNISCYGGRDGEYSPEIDSNWPAPYSIYTYSLYESEWYELNCGGCNLSAGDYKGEVIDSDGVIHESFVTLEQPDSLYSTITTFNDEGTCNGVASIDLWGGSQYATIMLDSIVGVRSLGVANLCAGSYPITITDEGENCFTYYDTVTIESTTSIESVDQIDINIYPNPITNSFFIASNIDNGLKTLIKLTDINGVEIFNKTSQKNLEEFDINKLSDGIYFLSIFIHGNLILTEKLIKNRR